MPQPATSASQHPTLVPVGKQAGGATVGLTEPMARASRPRERKELAAEKDIIATEKSPRIPLEDEPPPVTELDGAVSMSAEIPAPAISPVRIEPQLHAIDETPPATPKHQGVFATHGIASVWELPPRMQSPMHDDAGRASMR